MNSQEKEERKIEPEESESQAQSCCQKNGAEDMSKCCENVNQEGAGDMKAMMSKCRSCMKGFRWFPSIPVVVGILLFLFGYFMNPEILRILWLIASGAVVLAGLIGLILMSRFFSTRSTARN